MYCLYFVMLAFTQTEKPIFSRVQQLLKDEKSIHDIR